MRAHHGLIEETSFTPLQATSTVQRRALIGGAMGSALLALLASAGPAQADGVAEPNDPFILLLHGIYSPVTRAPELGLSTVNLGDGTYLTTRIYPVFGLPGSPTNENARAFGDFFVQFKGSLCAYQLPRGAMAMQFTSGGFTPHPDGQGGYFLEGTWELTVREATGIYRPFQGGHNHMVDRLHHLVNGKFDEFCFCVISQYQFP